MKKYKSNKFTLVELLIVIAVIGIIMMIALPSFSRIAKGKEITQAASEIRSQLMMARTHAVANRVHTAVVFPAEKAGNLEGLSPKTNTPNPMAYFNASCRIAAVYKDAKGDYVFKNWISDFPWVFLPTGIIIPPNNNDFTVVGSGSVTPVKTVSLGAIFKDTNNVALSKETDYVSDIPRAVIFKPNGQVVTTDWKPIKIRVAEAVYDPSATGASFKFIPSNRQAGSDPITYNVLEINPLTGKTTVSVEHGDAW